jgi:hypothetical protein
MWGRFMKPLFAACLIALWIASASAQESDGEALVPVKAENDHHIQLPAGTPIALEMTQTVTTQGGSWKEGDEFSLIVAEDVFIDQHVVIPKGTLAFGHVRWATGRGAFGKSGKIEIAIDHLLVGARAVRLIGVYRNEGKGELRSAGRIIAAGPLAGFITGESGEFLRGSQLTAFLAEGFSVVIRAQPDLALQGAPDARSVRSRQISVADAFEESEISTAQRVAQTEPAPKSTFNDAFGPEEVSPEKEQ